VLANGGRVECRKLILATGVKDILPEIPGFSELWGGGVIHCPYCHGWEFRERGGPGRRLRRRHYRGDFSAGRADVALMIRVSTQK